MLFSHLSLLTSHCSLLVSHLPGPISNALLNRPAGPRKKARKRGSSANRITLPRPTFSTAAQTAPVSSRSVLLGQLNPESTRSLPRKDTGLSPFLDGVKNVPPVTRTPSWSLSYP